MCDLAADLAASDPRFGWQCALMSGGNREATVYAQYGYAATGVCLGLGNYHNQGRTAIAAEYVHLDDFASGVRLLARLATTCRGRPASPPPAAGGVWRAQKHLLG